MKPDTHSMASPCFMAPKQRRLADVCDLAAPRYRQLQTRYDTATRSVWCWMNPTPRPCLNPQLLRELADLQSRLQAAHADPRLRQQYPYSHLILASKTPGVYGYGGDLELFQQLIVDQQRERLRRYAHACVHTLHQNLCNLHLPLTMVALVQGQALGGGFEAALSCDVIIAERGTHMGFPEVLFNLFPGMGAYNLLSRKIHPGLAERMILSGQTYSTEELYDMGIVDLLAEPGEGIIATENYLNNRNRAHHAVRHMKQVRRMTHPVTLQTLLDIVDLWVDAAMQLGARDLRKMQRLIHAQSRRDAYGDARAVPIKRRGEWRSLHASDFPLHTHLGETIEHERRRSPCRRRRACS